MLVEWQKVNLNGNLLGQVLVCVFQELQLYQIPFFAPPQSKEEVMSLWQTTDQCRSLYGYSVSGSDYLIILRSIIGANYPPGLEHRMGSKVHGLDATLSDLLYKNKESAEKTLIERI
jgi:hypothetical protein